MSIPTTSSQSSAGSPHSHRQFLQSLYNSPLFRRTIAQNVSTALEEDLAQGDIHDVLYDAEQVSSAQVITREDAIMCGQPWVLETFAQLSPLVSIEWFAKDGEQVSANQPLFKITGPTGALLSGERTALNFMQCLMATATQCAALAAHLRGTPTQILDTRKTLPGLRLAQKYAVTMGGGVNHRIGLWDAFLLKENHIAASGGIPQAIELARQHHPNRFLEVEVETLAELQQALEAKVDRVLLDNFTNDMLKESIEIRKACGSACDLEASGNVTEDTVRDIALTGVDFISVGGITKHIQAVDLSFRIIVSEP